VGRRKIRLFRIIAWIFAGFLSLILLTTLVFYLGRDYFVNRALNYINAQQPGEVLLEQVYLIPFLGFPDITLHLQQVKVYEDGLTENMMAADPLLSLEDIAVTLDLIQLIRGDVRISEARLKDGFVHVVVYQDSLTNLEHALGIRFGESVDKDTSQALPSFSIDLDQIELINVRTRLDNYLNDEFVDMEISQLLSSFSYHPEQIRSTLEVDIYLNRIKYQNINNQIDKYFSLNGSVSLDPDTRMLRVEPSNLHVSGLAFETWGTVDLGSTPRVDLAYTATNEGLELLNFLFLGILDLEEIEQIGGGSIHLNGTVQGNMGRGELPVIRVNGEAEDLGFRIKTVNRDVTGITFHLYATNGRISDLSEGLVEVQDFYAKFPEGDLNANFTMINLDSPELSVELESDVNLEGLEDMIKNNQLSNISGSLGIRGALKGSVIRDSGEFLHDDGALTAVLENVSFVYDRDSVNRDSVRYISGAFVLHDSIMEAKNLTLEYNGNPFELGIRMENLLLYLLDFDKDVNAGISISSDGFNTATLLGDTSLSSRIGEEIGEFHFHAGALIKKADLDNFLQHDSIPELLISLDSFEISMPLITDISNVNALLDFSPDTISLQHFTGTIGESSLAFSGLLSNYETLFRGDSGDLVCLDFKMSSDLLLAEDLFTINNDFLLPEDFRTESLQDFRVSGRIEASAAGLLYDSISQDFDINIDDLGWRFRYYPDPFKDFLIQVGRTGDHLNIKNIQGSIGDNNLVLSASIENFTDTLLENIYGSIELYSDLLDFNQLLSYRLPEGKTGDVETDSAKSRPPPKISKIDFPNIAFTVNIGEMRYGKHTIFGMDGKLRTSRQKVLYLDQFVTSPEGRGSLELNGQLNLTNPREYVLSAEMILNDIDINDLNLELQSGDSILEVKDHFYGIVNGRGLAEIFLTPELKIDIPSSVAQFALRVSDGALINFTPLQAAGKFLDNKDLNNVRFDELRNSFTLIDSRLIIPRMNVESTIGQLLIMGEQGLDGSYLYLVRVPPKLARQAARSAMSEGAKDDGEDQVVKMKRGNFLGITLWSNGTESEFKLGDRRNKYKK
jgi:hypothetical protein